MGKTMKQIADEAERRWTRAGLSEAQKETRRVQSKTFCINPGHKRPIEVNRESMLKNRVEADNKVAELLAARELREVWDE